MSAPSDFEFVLRSLKEILKKRKLTYRELARKLGLSESGLKKVFTAKDCSFKKLERICSVLDVNVGEILTQARSAPIRTVGFTLEQQKYLAEHMDVFHVFWKLVYERVEPKEVCASFKLSSRNFFKYVKKLDELRLVQLLPGDQIRLPKIEPIRWAGKGPLLDKVYGTWPQTLLDDARTDAPGYENQFIFRYYKLTEASRRELLQAFQDLEDEFLRRTIREMNFYKDELISVRMLSAISVGDFVKSL